MKSNLRIEEIVQLWPTNSTRIISIKNFKNLKIGNNKPILYKPCLKKRNIGYS